MMELLREKMELAKELRSLTKEITVMSVKTEYMKVNSMLDKRQAFIEKIDNINAELNGLCQSHIFIETNEIKALKIKLREIFKEIYELDNLIRVNINDELRNVKKSLNKPESSSRLLNLKA